jgi:hypothetical protein
MATQLRKTTDELLVDCEVASEVIAEYFAILATELANEKNSSTPNLEKVKTIESSMRELKKEKRILSPDNVDLINKALYNYATILKKRVST